MFDVYRKELDIQGKKIVLETGKIARQADGAVIVSMGETSCLVTATGAKEIREGQDFFPLTVNYQEKSFAAGKIPGGFFKREGRPSENETLVSRLIDRPIRPLFAEGFLNEVQVIATVLSHDMENNPDIVALIGASAALTLSGMPFMGPIAASRVGLIDGEFVLNPTEEELKESQLDLVVAGTQEGVLMVESEAHELDEKTMLDAVQFGHKGYQPIIDGIIQLAEQCAKEPWDMPAEDKQAAKLLKDLEKKFSKEVEKAYGIKNKLERQTSLSEIKSKAVEAFEDKEEGLSAPKIKSVFKKLESAIVRGNILKGGSRIDGRDTTTVRPIACEIGVVPRTHGSALFTRGETQALVVTTLGTGQDEQIIDALTGEYRRRFMLHYNFPPFSVGECGRVGSPGRREIGHGKLAWRAINPLFPSAEEFPYTVRSVTEVTESNGSSSMATVCGTSLAMMDAGIPLKRPVAGIAMGLIKEGKDFAVLSDILGDEDHLGDMDFKVAGTENGITSLQMDIKITSITAEIMEIALNQAKEGRSHILSEMSNAITVSRDEVKEHAPRIVAISIPTDKIRDVIGTGGKVIREIIEVTGTKIDVEDDGSIRIAGTEQAGIERALKWIKDLTDEPELHKVYDGKVVKTLDFGAFVNFLGAKDGLVHISEIADEHVNKVTDYIREGEMVKVQIIGFDDRGKVKLSMKRVDQETGEIIDSGEDDSSSKRNKRKTSG